MPSRMACRMARLLLLLACLLGGGTVRHTRPPGDRLFAPTADAVAFPRLLLGLRGARTLDLGRGRQGSAARTHGLSWLVPVLDVLRIRGGGFGGDDHFERSFQVQVARMQVGAKFSGTQGANMPVLRQHALTV